VTEARGARRAGNVLVAVVISGLWLATLAAALGRWSWICDLFTHFRVQYVELFALATVGAVLLRRRRWAIAAAAGLILNAIPVVPYVLPALQPSLSDARPIRVLSFNTFFRNRDVQQIAAAVEASHADVAVLLELNPQDINALKLALPSFGYVFEGAAAFRWGALILSKLPFTQYDAVPLSDDSGAVAAHVAINVGSRSLEVYGVHLNWPLTRQSVYRRNGEMRRLGQELARCVGACIVVGDFNVTPWSSYFGDLVHASGLRDCGRGQGFLATWPAPFWAPLRLRIDQCLISSGITIANVATGNAAGSDHLPAIADLLISGHVP
jgi:endonuclease/exonuclease/phosphatase (EEP) superfamily protein YafD